MSMLAAPCYSEKYYEVEVYQALLSIALIHVQVMLNFCTTLVSSATRATIKEKKKRKSFKCFNFRGAILRDSKNKDEIKTMSCWLI